MPLALLACLVAQLPKVTIRISQEINYGVYGPTKPGGFVVYTHPMDPSRSELWTYDFEGVQKDCYELPNWGKVVGVSERGSVVFANKAPLITFPEDYFFSAYESRPVVKVAGTCRVISDYDKGLYLATGPFGKRSIKVVHEYGATIDLAENPATLAQFNPREPIRLIVYDLATGKSRSVKLARGLAIKYQRAEFHLWKGKKVYFFTDGSLTSTAESIPRLRERERGKDERYYVRTLVEADLQTGACREIAQLETAHGDPDNKIRLGLSSTFPGNDIVVDERYLVVRGNSVVFVLPRPQDDTTGKTISR